MSARWFNDNISKKEVRKRLLSSVNSQSYVLNYYYYARQWMRYVWDADVESVLPFLPVHSNEWLRLRIGCVYCVIAYCPEASRGEETNFKVFGANLLKFCGYVRQEEDLVKAHKSHNDVLIAHLKDQRRRLHTHRSGSDSEDDYYYEERDNLTRCISKLEQGTQLLEYKLVFADISSNEQHVLDVNSALPGDALNSSRIEILTIGSCSWRLGGRPCPKTRREAEVRMNRLRNAAARFILQTNAAIVIQRAFRKSFYEPDGNLCWRRLKRVKEEFEEYVAKRPCV